MIEKLLFRFWFCLLAVFFLIRPGLAQAYRCRGFEDMTSHSSCQTGIPRFFYNRTSFGCEQFISCGSNKNSFDSQEGCEAFCNKMNVCFLPVEHGERPRFRFSDGPPPPDLSNILNFFFYNVSSWRCEGFHFKGSASNGNIFWTVEECESFCGGVEATTTSQPAVDPATTTSRPAVDRDASAPVTCMPEAVLVVGILLIIIVIVIVVVIVIFMRRNRQHPFSISFNKLLEQDR